MNAERKIIHIDMDAFFASIEQRDNPEYRGRPLIVGGDPRHRGVVAACSYEARQFGIHSAMSSSKAAKLCAKAIFVRPRMEQYKQVSLQLMKIFRNYTPLVEPLSMDEAFLDVTNNIKFPPSATLLAEEICRKIFRELHLTASAGVSYNKFLAKVASDLNKPNGISTIPPAKALEFLSTLRIRKFFGVGKITEKKMLSLGIKNGGDLRRYSKENLVHHFGKTGAFLYDTARGIDNRPVAVHHTRKSIGNETTLRKDSDDIVEINALLTDLSLRVAGALQRKNSGGHTITLKVRYDDFTTITRSISVRNTINCYEDIIDYLPKLIEKTEIGRRKVRLLGLSVTRLVEADRVPRQLLLPFL